ncbi:MAG: hypothetical protein C3F18_04640 [Nitrosomonadales bacterium]|nr:MAG: hypothetical protein C3F18_04640 [Nitrosomonadales bacterium]
MQGSKLLLRLLVSIGVTVTAQAYAKTCMADIRAGVVKFNTMCARCHEGECSGRLSFSSGVAAAGGHVRRYIPSSSPLEVEELFAILKYTKEACSHYPLPDAAPADGVWGVDALRQWRSPDGESYFIPLGRMRRGIYNLGLRFDGKAEASVRITSEKFDVLLEEQQRADQVFERPLPVAAEALYYLHLKSSATLLELTLTPAR